MTLDAERIARLQRLLDTLAQVRKQATDLSRMAEELHGEARESIQLVAETAQDASRPRRPTPRRPAARPRKQKRR